MKKMTIVLMFALLMCGCDVSDKELRGEITYYTKLLNSNDTFIGCEMSINDDDEIYRAKAYECKNLEKGDSIIIHFSFQTDNIHYIMKIEE